MFGATRSCARSYARSCAHCTNLHLFTLDAYSARISAIAHSKPAPCRTPAHARFHRVCAHLHRRPLAGVRTLRLSRTPITTQYHQCQYKPTQKHHKSCKVSNTGKTSSTPMWAHRQPTFTHTHCLLSIRGSYCRVASPGKTSSRVCSFTTQSGNSFAATPTI